MLKQEKWSAYKMAVLIPSRLGKDLSKSVAFKKQEKQKDLSVDLLGAIFSKVKSKRVAMRFYQELELRKFEIRDKPKNRASLDLRIKKELSLLLAFKVEQKKSPFLRRAYKENALLRFLIMRLLPT